jgi:hypothetical protein
LFAADANVSASKMVAVKILRADTTYNSVGTSLHEMICNSDIDDIFKQRISCAIDVQWKTTLIIWVLNNHNHFQQCNTESALNNEISNQSQELIIRLAATTSDFFVSMTNPGRFRLAFSPMEDAHRLPADRSWQTADFNGRPDRRSGTARLG